MTAKVVAFPKDNETISEKFHSLVQVYLNKMTSDSELIDYVANRMKDYVEKYVDIWIEPTFDLIVPPDMSQEQVDSLLSSIDKGLNNHIAQVQDMVNNMVIERIHFEVEMYKQLTKKTLRDIQKLGMPLH